MRPIEDLFSYYTLGNVQRFFTLSEKGSIAQSKPVFYVIMGVLNEFLDYNPNSEMLPEAYKAAEGLRHRLSQLFQLDEIGTFGALDYINLRNAVLEFRTHLKAELNGLPIFLLEEERGYSPKTLLKTPLKLFADSDAITLESLPFAKTNFTEAANCLAFGRYTATGFHAMRAVEEIVRLYFAMVTGRSHREINSQGKVHFRTLHAMNNELAIERENLEKTSAHTGKLGLINALLEQLTTVYRNPLDHPEIVELEADEARDVFVHAIGVISQILREIRLGQSYLKNRFGLENK